MHDWHQKHLSLEQAYSLHERAMAASSCGITISDARDPQLPLIYINPSFEAITGYSSSDALGRNCRFLQRDDRSQSGLFALRGALLRGNSCHVTLRNYRRDGELFWNEFYLAPVHSESGTLTHFVGIQTDVTARVLAEAQLHRKQSDLEYTVNELRDTRMMLIHAEKMNALGQMVAGIAHEINNPISFVNSNLFSLRDALRGIFEAYERLEAFSRQQVVGDEGRTIADIRADADLDFVVSDVDDLLAASIEGLARVKHIVESLRRFARLDEAEYKMTNLRECVQSALLIARGELNGRIDVVLDLDHLPDIRCYPAELNQVFLNIIVNAAQAMPERGRLTIKGWDEGGRVCLAFADTGMGMTPEVQEKLFTPFFTTKPSGVGVGLGLAIAYKIVVDHHRGAITVNSLPGEGSTFTVSLPKDVRR
jgi:PAS domain S-box-containing protein